VECVICQISDLETRLAKCPICFRWACENCGMKAFGRIFCSKNCSDQFFFGEDDEE
jgi:hypothetical protein